MVRWTIIGVLGTVALIVLVLSRFVHFGYTEDDKTETTEAIKEFHDRLDGLEFAKIYENADDSLKASANREDLVMSMQKTRSHWGKLKSLTCAEPKVVMGAPVQIQATCTAQFDAGPATELFLFTRQGSTLNLARYQIYQRQVTSPDEKSVENR
jgi:hypothetical protein